MKKRAENGRDEQTFANTNYVEPFVPLTHSADPVGVPLYKLRRAAKAGVFPVYHIANKRPLVRVSEIVRAIEASRKGGTDVG